jgi:hypothetical protein
MKPIVFVAHAAVFAAAFLLRGGIFHQREIDLPLS